MGTLTIMGSGCGSALNEILGADDIVPGSEPSYQMCRTIYLHHPLGAKVVEMPVKMAQSQERIITIEGSPENEVREQFLKMRKEIRADYYIRGVAYTARIYGVGTLICGTVDQAPDEALDLAKLSTQEIYLSTMDALNTAGSIVLDQNPNSPTFQRVSDITVSGVRYHRSRSCVLFNEQPVYISYTSSAFGFSGRSVYQRALYPLKSFIQTMITDDMVSQKAGLLVAFIKGAGSIVNKMMQAAANIKRFLLKEAAVGNVLSVGDEDRIESIDLQNIDKAMITARGNIIKNIATAVPMPAQIIEQESFAEGFGEGTEDTKNIVRFVQEVRDEIQPLYDFTDNICMYKAWTPEFIATVRTNNPGLYDDKTDAQVFYEWKNAFRARWPSLLEGTDEEKSKMEKVKLEGLVSVCEIILSKADPENVARAMQWLQDNCNEFKHMFPIGLDLDIEALSEFVQEQKEQADESHSAEIEPKPALALARGR